MNKEKFMVEKILKLLGFKKFMWMHVSAYLLFIIIMLGQSIDLITKENFDSADVNNLIEFLIEMIVVYIALRVFQLVVNPKVNKDRYMFFWTKKKNITK